MYLRWMCFIFSVAVSNHKKRHHFISGMASMNVNKLWWIFIFKQCYHEHIHFHLLACNKTLNKHFEGKEIDWLNIQFRLGDRAESCVVMFFRPASLIHIVRCFAAQIKYTRAYQPLDISVFKYFEIILVLIIIASMQMSRKRLSTTLFRLYSAYGLRTYWMRFMNFVQHRPLGSLCSFRLIYEILVLRQDYSQWNIYKKHMCFGNKREKFEQFTDRSTPCE